MLPAECAACRSVFSTKEPYVAMEDHGICGVGIRYNRNSLALRSTQHGRFLRAARIHRAAREADALAARFANRTAAIYARHGITNVGYWIPQESDPELGISAENTFIYMRGYPSKEERDKRLKAAHDDPEFGEVVTKQEQNPDTKLIVKTHNIDVAPNGAYTAITITK